MHNVVHNERQRDSLCGKGWLPEHAVPGWCVRHRTRHHQRREGAAGRQDRAVRVRRQPRHVRT